MKTIEEIETILSHFKNLGLKSVTIDGITYEFKDLEKIVNPYVPELKPEEIVKPLSPFDELTEEEILYWATPYGKELEARKKAQQEQKHFEDELRSA